MAAAAGICQSLFPAPVIPSLAVVAVTRMTLEGPIVGKFIRLQSFFSSSILETTNFSYGESSS